MNVKNLKLALTLATLLLPYSAEAQTLPERLAARQTVGAHRGGGLSPKQNTIAQFEEAVQQGADIVEMDLRITKDGIPVIFHDKTLSKLTRCSGTTKNYTYAELARCQFKKNNEVIPTFEQVLQWAKGRTIINAEFKDPATIAPALALMRKYNALEWTYFQTQELVSNYQRVRQIDREANLIYFAPDMKALNWALAQKDPRIFAIELDPRLHSIENVNAVHATGRLTSTCSFQTVKDKEQKGVAACTALFRMGFDILITEQTSSCVEQRNSLEL